MNLTKKSKPEPRKCECGCGAMTSGTRFRQGHDAKLKSTLIQAALSGSKRATDKLAKLGWSKFLDMKRTALSVPERQRKHVQASSSIGKSNLAKEHREQPSAHMEIEVGGSKVVDFTSAENSETVEP